MPGTVSMVVFAAHHYVLQTNNDISQWPAPMIHFQVRIMRDWPRIPLLVDVLYEIAVHNLKADIPVGTRPN